MFPSIRSHNGITPKLGHRVYIDPAATVIGDVLLGDEVSVWPGAVIRGDVNTIKVGHRSNVQDNAVLHVSSVSEHNPNGWPLNIGDNVVIGHRAILHGCTLANLVLVGNGAIISDGVVVDEEVIIGAGCLVPPGKRLASGYVYVGNPCKRLRPIREDERRLLAFTCATYVRLKDQYLAEQCGL